MTSGLDKSVKRKNDKWLKDVLSHLCSIQISLKIVEVMILSSNFKKETEKQFVGSFRRA
ncbi:unnamed protein product [Brassica rapa]|uniref:Uncharacterized protein n=1 Tax=Brassica campestris TaxID=3711 RepID=A0A3P6C4K1_BRACM|nr:unnamed protein product [Brassica rapa]VDD13457.1 unnamed protein product [Brassica rapa]